MRSADELNIAYIVENLNSQEHFLRRIALTGLFLFLASPRLVLVRCILHTFRVQSAYHPIQHPAPHLLEPPGIPEPPDNGGAGGVVSADERSSKCAFAQSIVPEPPQGPDLGAVVGAVDAGGDVAALAVGVPVAAKHTGITVAGDFSTGVPVLVATEEGWIGMADLVAVGIIVIVAAKNAGFRVTNLVPFGVVGVVAAENTGLAVTSFLAVFVIVIDSAKETGFTSAFVCHDAFPPFLFATIVASVMSDK